MTTSVHAGLMETYALNVGGGKRRGIPIIHAQKKIVSVSQTALSNENRTQNINQVFRHSK